MTHQPGVYVPLRALFLVLFRVISNLLFWSYGPLKKFEKNLVRRISQKVFLS